MTAGAKKITPVPPSTGIQIVDRTPPMIAVQQVAMLGVQDEAAKTFGEGLPYVRDIYIAESRRDICQTVEAAVRIGRRLIVMKAHEAHGDWLTCLGQIGLSRQTAARMMMAARRMATLPNVSAPVHLLAAVQGQAKLFELLALPDDQFAELAIDGETGELSLEDVERMTMRELREAVRNARADIDAKDERAAKREREVERLTADLRKANSQRLKATPDQTTADLRARCSLAALQVRIDLRAAGNDAESLAVRFSELIDHGVSTDTDHSEFMAGLIGELLSDIRALRDEHSLPIVNDHGAPDWLKGV